MPSTGIGDALYRILLQTAMDGFVLLGPDGDIRQANEAYCAMTGYSREELCGMKIAELEAGEEPAVGPGSGWMLSAAEKRRFETRHRRKSGDVFDVEVSVHNYPEAGALVAFVRDISRRKNSERELGILRAAVEQSGSSIVITDTHGRIEFVNPAAAQSTGYSAEEMLGATPAVLKSGLQSDAFYRELWVTISSGRVWRGQFHNRRRDGSLYWEEATISPILDSAGRVAHFIAVKADVSEKRKLEEELRAALDRANSASRTKSEFLAIMSHELRTPLSTVLGFADLLSDTPLDPTQCEYLATLRGAGQRLLQVMSDILDYSSLEKGSLIVERSPVSVGDLLESCREIFRQPALEKGLDFACEPDPGAPGMVYGDARRIQQILGHLLGNAVKFTEAGSVALRVRVPRAQSVYFSVTDTGPGIPHEMIGRLFEPFTQADSTTRRNFGGAGVGLTLSRRLAEAMGGEIIVESEVGRGSTFILRLPHVESAIAPPPQSAPRGPARKPKVVMVVEDDPVSSVVARKMLAKLGYEAVVCTTGRSAVEQFEPDKFCAVLMDLRMPEMDGLEATRRIREIEQNASRVPIIALTADVLAGDRESCIEAGMDAYLAKPILIETLAAKLELFVDAKG